MPAQPSELSGTQAPWFPPSLALLSLVARACRTWLSFVLFHCPARAEQGVRG